MMDDQTSVDLELDRRGLAIDAGEVEADEADPVSDLPWEGARPDGVDAVSDLRVRERIRAQLLGETRPLPRLGRFRLLRALGRGGMGTVYAAYDDELQREVAIKLLHSDTCTNEAAQHRLVREAQAQARLSHPHLVPVFEVGRFEDQIYLAMELVDGVTMLEWITVHSPSPREIVAQWLDVARALVVVHAEGMVHRDIKPTNVLVGRDGRARLVDFGLARGQALQLRATLHGNDSAPSRLDQTVTQSRAMVGTPAYLAPEVLRGEPAGYRSDQYSLCVSLYEIHPRGSQPRDTTRLLAETLEILRGCPLVRSGREWTRVDGSRHRSSKTLLDKTARDRGGQRAEGPVATLTGSLARVRPRTLGLWSRLPGPPSQPTPTGLTSSQQPPRAVPGAPRAEQRSPHRKISYPWR